MNWTGLLSSVGPLTSYDYSHRVPTPICDCFKWRWKFLSSGVALPLVLPPTVWALHLVAIGPQDRSVVHTEIVGRPCSFSFQGCSWIHPLRLPFAVQPFAAASSNRRKSLKIRGVIRLSNEDVLSHRALSTAGMITGRPQRRPKLGEFGVVIMVGREYRRSARTVPSRSTMKCRR